MLRLIERMCVPRNMSHEPSFIAAQRKFAAYLRDPAACEIPLDLPEARIAVYRNAVYHNIEYFMGDNFPRVKALFSEDDWHSLVRAYVRDHRAEAAAFAHLPDEFLAYLGATEIAGAPPYLYELAHFEWLENALSIDTRRIEVNGIVRDGDLINGEIAVNPIHEVVRYDYPVHSIDTTDHHRIVEPKETHLVAFRDTAHQFQFLELNPIALQLFCTVRDHPQTRTGDILREISRALGRTDPAPVLAGGLDILERMRARELILGTRDS